MKPDHIQAYEERVDEAAEKINGEKDDVTIIKAEGMDKQKPSETPVKMTVVVE